MLTPNNIRKKPLPLSNSPDQYCSFTENCVALVTENINATESTIKESMTVQKKGNRRVKRKIEYYNLGLINLIDDTIWP